MSVITRITRRFTYPVESPFTSLTLYYGVLIGAAMLLYRYVPILRPAFTGARLMHMAGQGDNIFADQAPVVASGTLSVEFALLLGVSMLGATLLMLPTAVVYMATRQKKGFDQSVVQTIVILAMAVAGVVVIVRNSLALAFSLAGIVGAVRFRNSLSDTRDTLYIFISIGVGLAAGVEALPAAVVLSIVFNYTVLSFSLLDFGLCDLGKPAGHMLHTARFLASRADAKGPATIQQRQHGGQAVLKYLVRIGKRAAPADLEDALIQIGGPAVIGARIH